MISKKVFYGVAGGLLGYKVYSEAKEKIPPIMTTVTEKSNELKSNVKDSVQESYGRIRGALKEKQQPKSGFKVQEQNIMENVKELETRLDHIKANINHMQ